MTETRFLDGSAASCIGIAAGQALRKRKASNSSILDQDFIAFLKDTGVLDSVEEDPSIADLLRSATGQLVVPEAMNDLPGSLSFRKQEHSAVEPVLSDTATRETVVSQLSGPSSQALQQQGSTPAQQQQARNYGVHRAVITAMPLPTARAADDDADDTNSAATLPMPNKRRRTDDDEVTSSPNDLVEMPSTTIVTTASGTAAAATATSKPAAAKDTAAGPDQAGANGKAAAAADASVVKAILVAKVLTKSDANSKRVILPRIAVEANLPQLSHAQVFNLSATDPSGASWPLVIKAWANGQNPKPVYVLEQVGELLKQYKLTTGDAFALMASEDGRFFLEWNTDAARAAAARPTYSAFTFKQQAHQHQQKQQPATSARGKAAAAAVAAKQQATELTAQQREHPAQQHCPAVVVKAEQQQPAVAPQQQQQQPAPVKVQAAPQQWQQRPVVGPLMTAIPVTSAPLISGTFIPTSPCQLLVMNSDNPFAGHLQMDDPLLPALPRELMMIKTRSDVAFELPEPASLAPVTAAAGNAVEGESLLVPVSPEAGENGALHAGGFLLCPRTPGCTRPAGHQGWCLGHKGYKKRRV